MALTDKLYIVKLENGEQIGPCEEEVLVKLAEEGKITANAEVRSKLIADWNKASTVKFLKDIIFKQQQEKLEEIATADKSLKERILERIYLVAPQIAETNGIVKIKPETFPAASPGFRLVAGFVDLIIILIGWAVIFFGCYTMLDAGILDDSNCVEVAVLLMMLFSVMYFTLCINFMTQTVGQRQFGIVLIKNDGKPFWISRAFFFGVLVTILGPFTIFFLMTNSKTIPELLTNTRMAKVVVPKKK